MLFLAFGRSQGQFATTATAMLTTTTATAGQAEEPPPCLSVSLYRSCRPLRRPCRSYRCSTSTAFSSLSHVLVGAGNNFATSHCHRAPQFFSGTNAIDNTNPCSPHFPSSSFGACRSVPVAIIVAWIRLAACGDACCSPLLARATVIPNAALGFGSCCLRVSLGIPFDFGCSRSAGGGSSSTMTGRHFVRSRRR